MLGVFDNSDYEGSKKAQAKSKRFEGEIARKTKNIKYQTTAPVDMSHDDEVLRKGSKPLMVVRKKMRIKCPTCTIRALLTIQR